MHRRRSSERRGRRARRLGWTTLSLLLLAGAPGSFATSAPSSEFRLVGYGGVATGVLTASTAGSTAMATEGTPKDAFSIGGSVKGLYPGATLPLVLTVINTKAFAITVISISTVVSGPSSFCNASNVHVTGFAGHLRVRARGQAMTTVEVVMAHGAPDACQGSVFPFQYVGKARS